jgi:hypothetical protein
MDGVLRGPMDAERDGLSVFRLSSELRSGAPRFIRVMLI